MTFVDIGTLDDIPERGARLVKTRAGTVAVFRTSAGQVYAVEDKCPHLAGPLSQGIVHGGRVTCPLHNLVIDLASGAAEGPDGGCVRTYPVQLREGRIHLGLDAQPSEKVA